MYFDIKTRLVPLASIELEFWIQFLLFSMADRIKPTTLHLYRIHISIILDNEEEMYDRSSYNIHMPEKRKLYFLFLSSFFSLYLYLFFYLNDFKYGDKNTNRYISILSPIQHLRFPFSGQIELIENRVISGFHSRYFRWQTVMSKLLCISTVFISL